jgi:NADH:ubiquinone oxidoreductase subunit 5 (subunit L)/multisubunit Na+/H+ antiporter MnhA subunit
MFLAAGSVLHGTGTKDMERLGGLLKVMPRTGSVMIMGAVAIAGLPPLNGFVSEWLLYMGLMRGGLSHEGVSRAVLLLSVGVIALIGGLAIACFVRLVGTALLGEPRSDTARHAHESDRPMTVPLAILAAACAAMAVLPNAVIPALSRVSELVLRLSRNDFHGVLSSAESPLAALAALNVAVWVAIGLVAVALARLRRLQPETGDSTWGCGYAAPTARMQYTSTSLSELLAERVFPRFLRARVHTARPSGLFPAEASFASDRPDPLSERVYEPFFARWAERLARLRWVQRGKVHGYLIYIFVVVVASFAWLSVRGWVVK